MLLPLGTQKQIMRATRFLYFSMLLAIVLLCLQATRQAIRSERNEERESERVPGKGDGHVVALKFLKNL